MRPGAPVTVQLFLVTNTASTQKQSKEQCYLHVIFSVEYSLRMKSAPSLTNEFMFKF